MSTNLTGDAAGVSFNSLSMWKKVTLTRPRDSPDKVSVSKGGRSTMPRDERGPGQGQGKPFVPFVSPLLVEAGDTQLPCDDIQHVAFVLKIKLMGLS
jgi:hypothetical protein